MVLKERKTNCGVILRVLFNFSFIITLNIYIRIIFIFIFCWSKIEKKKIGKECLLLNKIWKICIYCILYSYSLYLVYRKGAMHIQCIYRYYENTWTDTLGISSCNINYKRCYSTWEDTYCTFCVSTSNWSQDNLIMLIKWHYKIGKYTLHTQWPIKAQG